ncbi:MAG: amidohydrolase family protein [Gemmatimonadota bacterium]|nr:amidohydrolase family protein [Gemmatimonadota bacterium]
MCRGISIARPLRRPLLAALTVGFVAGTPVLAAQSASEQGTDYDVILVGGRVLDGTGNPWFRADVGIRGDRIAAVGDLSAARAGRVVELDGRTIVPGFIDIHSHADEGLGARGGAGSEGARRRAAPNLVSQGVTTVVVNQDGRSAWPIADQRARYEDLGIGPNAALMIGHGTVRGLAMGNDFRRPATDAEVGRMRELVRQGMAEGAYGLSAGLEYVPGRWSETSEVIEVVEEAGAANGIYVVHERSSGMTPMWFWPSVDDPGPPTMIDTILEDIEVAETTGTTTVATHIKARGSDFWGASRVMIQLIDRARDRGVPIWADAYPYNTTGSDGGTVLIPSWFFEQARREERPAGTQPDFGSALEDALRDVELAERIRTDIDHEIGRRGGAENLMIMDHPDPDAVGKTLAELAALNGTELVEMAIRLQLEGDRSRPGGARVRGFSLSELDVGAFAGKEWLVTASDAGIAMPGDRPVHARYYGTFPRKIRRYAIEQGALSVQDAVRSATTLPAQIMGIRDRGAIREGMIADIAVLDLDRLEDTATFFEPHSYATGVDYVLVNGEFVVEGGELTYALPGRILTPAESPRGARTGPGS